MLCWCLTDSKLSFPAVDQHLERIKLLDCNHVNIDIVLYDLMLCCQILNGCCDAMILLTVL